MDQECLLNLDRGLRSDGEGEASSRVRREKESLLLRMKDTLRFLLGTIRKVNSLFLLLRRNTRSFKIKREASA